MACSLRKETTKAEINIQIQDAEQLLRFVEKVCRLAGVMN